MTITIPRRSELKIQEEANENWGGSRDKVPNTHIQSLTVRGILLKSRYQHAEDFERMMTIVLELPDDCCAATEQLHCDSKRGCAYQAMVARGTTEQLAERIADRIAAAAFRPVSGGGHNGVSVVRLTGKNSKDIRDGVIAETEHLVDIRPEWPAAE